MAAFWFDAMPSNSASCKITYGLTGMFLEVGVHQVVDQVILVEAVHSQSTLQYSNCKQSPRQLDQNIMRIF